MCSVFIKQAQVQYCAGIKAWERRYNGLLKLQLQLQYQVLAEVRIFKIIINMRLNPGFASHQCAER